MRHASQAVWILALGMAASASAATPSLTHLPPIAKDNDSLPRLAGALTPAEARVNAALAKLDARWRAFRRDCRPAGGDRYTSRSVSITMQTSRILGLQLSDEASCGGAHPDEAAWTLVYDLDAGKPVNWAVVLGPRLVKSSTVDSTIDGTKVGFIVATPALQDLYLKRVKADANWQADCEDALADPDLAFVVSADAKAGGLTIWPGDLPHAIQACADPVTVPTSTLRKLGADPAFLDQLDAAHRAH